MPGAPELAPYRDEPEEMASGAPGHSGLLDMAFARRGNRSVLTHLARRAPLLAQQALYWAAGASWLPHDAGLVYKVLGMETEPVKAMVRAFWNLVRQEVAGAPIPDARPWGPPLGSTTQELH